MILQILVLFVGLGIWWFFRDRRKYAEYPPGPVRFPFVGSLVQVATRSPFPAIAFEKLAKIYGDVVHVKLGVVDAISFNSYESAMDILTHDKAAGRVPDLIPVLMERIYYRNLGIVFSNGETWQILRRFTLRTLREFGFGKAASMDIVINEEYDKFSTHFETLRSQSSDSVVEVNGLFDLTVTNILWRFITGINYEMGDPQMTHFLKLNNKFFESMNFGADITMAYPFLWSMFPTWSGKNMQIRDMNEFRGFVRDIINEQRKAGTFASNPESYLDAFLEKIDETKDDPSSEYNDDQLLLCIYDLFAAGSETSSRSLDYAILYMLLNPDIQQKVHSEIDRVITTNEPITLSMKPKLPYTNAALLEITRFASVIPIPPARMATEDFRYKGYLIKKGMILMPNIQAVHFSEPIWGDPHNFRPERFLTSDGVIDSVLAGHLVTFGAGKRVCVGQQVAETTLFLYFTSLLRNYKFLKVPGEKDPSIVPKIGIANSPYPFKVLVQKRN